ncbi:glycosyltransferase [Nonomuraea sp. NPDC050663]|uniref:glycosyltransferase n=1 Tax=Nonomuraea sp. NPDC050663 TaxID=3364370 RepID=UPI0037A0E711
MIRGNDYGVLSVPELGAWTPELTVTVVIPARDCQADLDRTLAAVHRQTYPRHLVEVIVADDGSSPALTGDARFVRPGEGWGRGAARQAGARAATGQVIHWLDADVVLADDHLEAHMRWHHALDYAVVIGDLVFLTPEETRSAYTVKKLEETRRLKDAGSSAYLLHTGATTSVRRSLLEAAGGVDITLNMAEDTELGYRLAQAGAVFVADEQARAWHHGPSTVMNREKEVHRHNWSFLGDLIPDLRWLRNHPRRQWLVPYVRVVVPAGGYEETRTTVDSALAQSLPDIAVTIVGPWDTLTGERRASLDDPRLDLRLTRNLYAHEPRVDFATRAPLSAAPAPYLLTVPAGWALGGETVARLIKQDLGLVSVALAEGPDGVVAARLERTAAFSRARLHEGDADDLVHEMAGSIWVGGAECGFSDVAEPLGGDAAKWRAVAADRGKEIERLKAEIEELTAAKSRRGLLRALRSAG